MSAEAKRLKELSAENVRLKKLLAESLLENEVTREALQKMWWPHRRAGRLCGRWGRVV